MSIWNLGIDLSWKRVFSHVTKLRQDHTEIWWTPNPVSSVLMRTGRFGDTDTQEEGYMTMQRLE
jgi:hypothetical protein